MSTKNYLTHKVTDTPPTFSDVGDEYYSPRTNILYKKVVYNGTNVAWSQIVSTGTDGNITLTGNSISFLANNKYPIYFGATNAPVTSNNFFVGINTTGYINGYGGSSGNNQPAPNANVSIFFQPKGQGGILTSIPDVTYNGSTFVQGNPGGWRGGYSVDLQLSRGAKSSIASGDYSALLGGYDNMASGQYSVAVGGSGVQVSGLYAGSIGGLGNYVDGAKSVILGGNYAWTRSIAFYTVITNSGIVFGSAGSSASYAQGASMSLGGSTTTATQRILTSDGTLSVTTVTGSRNVLFLPNNSLFGFKGTVVAAVTGGSGVGNAAWTFEGSIARGANAAATTL